MKPEGFSMRAMPEWAGKIRVGFPSSEMQRRVARWKSADVSVEHVASIFREEEYAK
jgi:hypothetical protein